MLITQLLGSEPGFYVDVGAFHPWVFSNTALLYQRGWRGINIDADTRAIERFKIDRPEDTNIHMGIAATSGTAEFAVFQGGAVNTFDKDTAVRQSEHFGFPEVQIIRTEPLGSLLAEHMKPGCRLRYLNVDCEGLDEVVLRSNDWERFRPDVISAELPDMHPEAAPTSPIYQYLRELGYVMRANYFATSIFHHISAMG